MTAPTLAGEIVTIDMRDGAILDKLPISDDRLSGAGPVFAGRVLVVTTRSTAGGPARLTGYTVDVEILAGGSNMGKL